MRFARTIIETLLVLGVILMPAYAAAQSTAQDSLRATIRSAITADPRSSGMSQAQIDALVNALSNQAAKQGITPQQITWRPYNTDTLTPAPAGAAPEAQCPGFPNVFCEMTSAFGFLSPDVYIPIALFAAAAAFVTVVALMRHHRHPHAEFATPSSM